MYYYKHVLGIARKPGLWSELGKEIQEELSKYVEQNFKIIDKEVYLEDQDLGICGRVDYVVEDNNGVAPLEVKYTKKLKPWWKYTIVAYALLMETKYGKPVKNGYLLIPKPVVIKINITDSHRRYILESIDKIRAILNGRYIPRQQTTRSCRNCDYRDICDQ